MTYIFRVSFNLHTSGHLYIPGLDKVIFEIDNELTLIQQEQLKTKISQWFTNKLGLITEINLEQIIK
jgi:hypothetical protein